MGRRQKREGTARPGPRFHVFVCRASFDDSGGTVHGSSLFQFFSDLNTNTFFDRL
jgi:hypothetical protein